jgi:hypothetical protein
MLFTQQDLGVAIPYFKNKSIFFFKYTKEKNLLELPEIQDHPQHSLLRNTRYEL